MSDLLAKDKAYVWHPYSSLKSDLPMDVVKSAKGVWIELEDGRKKIDAISSWWVNNFGHANEAIAKAIYDQALKLEHVIFAGHTHEPAIRLAERLIQKLPGTMDKIFYCDNGSTAVEVALKLSLQYFKNQGLKKIVIKINFKKRI